MKWAGATLEMERSEFNDYMDKIRARAQEANKTKPDIDNIIDSLDEQDRSFLNVEEDEEYLTVFEGSGVVKRLIQRDNDKAVAFCDLLRDGDTVTFVIATMYEYRRKGYAKSLVQQALNWLKNNKDEWEKIAWSVDKGNAASIKLAEQYGFELDPWSVKEDDRFIWYYKNNLL